MSPLQLKLNSRQKASIKNCILQLKKLVNNKVCYDPVTNCQAADVTLDLNQVMCKKIKTQ